MTYASITFDLAQSNWNKLILQINCLSSGKFNASLTYVFVNHWSNKIFIKEQSVTRNSRTMVLDLSLYALYAQVDWGENIHEDVLYGRTLTWLDLGGGKVQTTEQIDSEEMCPRGKRVRARLKKREKEGGNEGKRKGEQ